MSQEKEAQIKFYKTREDKEIKKVIALENKVKALDDIVYEIGQSVQTMNMLNHNYKMIFVKPEFLKKAQRANPHLYHIGCYNDNLALMLAPESDETIRLAQESRSKLSDLIRPFNYEKLNNLYDLFVPQREKSHEQRYFSERINADLEKFHLCLKEEMVADLRYFNSLEHEVDSLKSQHETQKTHFLNEIDRLSREYYYADHMNAILGVYTTLDEFTDLQCDYVDQVVNNVSSEKELQKSISRPQLKSNQLEDRVMPNNSQGKKKEVEEHHRNFKISNNKISVTACNDSLNAKTSNVRHLVGGYPKFTPSGYKWKPKSPIGNVNTNVSMPLGNATRIANILEPMTPRLVQRGLHAQVRIVRTDKGTKFLNKTLHAYFVKEGIEHQTSIARRPEQNGVVERQNRTLVEVARTQCKGAKVLFYFWVEAIATSFFTQNRSLVITRHEKTPYTSSHGQKTVCTIFHLLGLFATSTVMVEHFGQNEGKDGVSSDPVPQCPTMALEHDRLSPGPQSQENVPQAAKTSSAINAVDATIKRQQQHTTPSTSTTVVADTPPLNIQTTPETTSQAPTQAPTVTANENINQAETNKEYAQVEEDEFINIFSTRNKTSARNKWRDVYVRTYLDRPLYKNVINMKWLWKNKRDEENTVIRNKARLVAKGYSQAWYDELSNFLVSKGFSKGSIDPTLFITKHEEDILLVQIYVDDIIFGSMNPKLLKRFEKLMHSKFEMSMMGELKFFLGIQIHQSPRGTFINQAKYAQEILNKHGMTLCDSNGTPMAMKHLVADLSGTPVDQTKYYSMVGALMYLTASRPDIVHTTCYCARYQARPTEKHLTAVKRIFRYLNNTIHMGLWYPKDTSFELTAFSDSDHAGCLDSQKSTSGGIQFLGGDKLVSWSSKKQDCTSMSSLEAEYVSLIACCAQVLWLRTQLTDYGFYFDKIPMYCDSKAAIAISCNPV
ncbi:retrovirus-related pol polyprotein from transposon TNT 1-94 [Tanacetum coccineum]